MMPVTLDVSIVIGSSGAVSSYSGLGIASVTKAGTGNYQIQLQDNYYSMIGFSFHATAGVTGGAITAGSFVTGTTYQIVTVGTTDYTLVGLGTSTTAAAGVIFTASGAGTGTGTVKALGVSGVTQIEVVGSPELQPSNNPANNNGGFVNIQTLAPTITAGAYTPAGTVQSHTHTIPAGTDSGGGTSGATAPTFTGTAASLTATSALAAANPTAGATLHLRLMFNNSSVQ